MGDVWHTSATITQFNSHLGKIGRFNCSNWFTFFVNSIFTFQASETFLQGSNFRCSKKNIIPLELLIVMKSIAVYQSRLINPVMIYSVYSSAFFGISNILVIIGTIPPLFKFGPG